MSSILKALKKVERERAMRLDVPLELGRDILRGEPRRNRWSLWSWSLLTVVVLSGAAGVVWWLNRPGPIATTTSPSTATGSVAASPPATVVAVAVPPRHDAAVVEELVEQRQPLAVGVLTPLPDRTPAARKPAAPVAPKTSAAVPAGTAPTATAPKPRIAAVAKTESAPTPASSPAVAAPMPNVMAAPSRAVEPVMTADHGLVVQAIAFSPRREERLAVVNELPVMEGTVIGAFRVDEILSDRVVFSREGSHLVVPLGSP